MTLNDLNQHLALREKLVKANEMIASLRDAAYPGSPRLDGMPHASGVSDKVGDLAAEIADMDTRIAYLEAEVARAEKPVIAYINAIGDDQTRLIFRLRFIRCLAWKEVAGVLRGGNTEASVKNICYRYIESCNELVRGDA